MPLKIKAGIIDVTPQLIYCIIWTSIVLISYILANDGNVEALSDITALFIVGTGVVFIIFGTLLHKVYKGNVLKAKLSIYSLDYNSFRIRLNRLAYIWIVLYLINIIGSGGIPIVWNLIGDSRTYSDFGLYTLGGLCNMLRAFILSGCYIVYRFSSLGQKIKNNYVLLSIALVTTAFIFELSRGAGIVLILHPVAIYFLTNNLKATAILKKAILFFIFLGITSFIQFFRNPDFDISDIDKYAINSGFYSEYFILNIFAPVLMYATGPILNLDLAIKNASYLQFESLYSVQTLLPSIIRVYFENPGDYGLLINDANNVTSYIVPFLRDFGVIGGFFGVSVILFGVSYNFAKARAGSLHHIIFYPPVFMCTVLSFFNLYYTTLVVILYIVPTIWILRR